MPSNLPRDLGDPELVKPGGIVWLDAFTVATLLRPPTRGHVDLHSLHDSLARIRPSRLQQNRPLRVEYCLGPRSYEMQARSASGKMTRSVRSSGNGATPPDRKRRQQHQVVRRTSRLSNPSGVRCPGRIIGSNDFRCSPI